MKYKTVRPFNHDELGKFERDSVHDVPKEWADGLLALGYIEPVRKSRKQKKDESEETE